MRRSIPRLPLAWLGAGLLVGCIAAPVASPTPTPSASPEPTLTAEPTPSGTPLVTAAPDPTPSAEPELALDLPRRRDDRVVSVAVDADVGPDGGEVIVHVTNESNARIDELVVRWPRGLNRTLFLRPFVPSADRIADGGPPLIQTWTKWVVGPGEEGEPAGTVSLGYGPMPGGATFDIPLYVVRRADGPVAFDLQVLAENSVLTLPDGEPAEIRVEVP